MKKPILMVLLLALAIMAVAGCGSSVDYSKLVEANQKLADAYNEQQPIMAQNGWEADEVTSAEFAAIANTVDQMNSIITAKDSTQDTVDDLTTNVEAMVTAMDDIAQKVSVPYGS